MATGTVDLEITRPASRESYLRDDPAVAVERRSDVNAIGRGYSESGPAVST